MATGEGRVYAKYWNGYSEVIAEDSLQVEVLKVDIAQDEVIRCQEGDMIVLSLQESYSSGGYRWSSEPPGIEGAGRR